MNSDNISLEDMLKLARDTSIEKKLGDIVIASTRGDTGLAAARIFKDTKVNLIVVGHSIGFKEPNLNSFSQDARREIEALGGKVLQSTMPFHSINDAIRAKSGTSTETLIADTLRMLGQGTKVCVEIVAMACDNGLIESGRNVLAIAGTGKGADTVLVLRSANSKRLFDMRIIEVIAKPEKI
jgi:hypothetical protein